MSARRHNVGAAGASAALMGTALAAAAFASPGNELAWLVVAGVLIGSGTRLATWALFPSPTASIGPGPCWAIATEKPWPGRLAPIRCTLQAGHAGAHVCDDLPHGGRLTWIDR